jgi:tRNA(Ile)-lysidine synthase TilS/MesJ
MGHNQDDCLENIFTNIAHKNKYENLNGMLPITCQDGINFLRPLLDTPKDDIINFARQYNIPYLPTSTPSWSQRGQIRNTIVPCLDNWDKNFVPSMFSLSETMASLHKLLGSFVNQFISNGEYNEDNTRFTIHNINIDNVPCEDVFWREFFMKTFGMSPSSKSIKNLIASIIIFKSCFTSLQVNEKKRVMITKNMCFQMTKTGSNHLSLVVRVKVPSHKN